MNDIESRGGCQVLWAALTDCPVLTAGSPERDHLWLVVQGRVCTRGAVAVTPLGSSARVMVSSEYATDELIAAMTWLHTHEAAARLLPPLELFIKLRGVATRGAHGSGRAAQADDLHGMTGVEQGQPIHWRNLGETGAA